jgi:hypothetical protein
MWRAQVLPAIRGAQLVGLLDGTDAAPERTITVAPADSDAAKDPKIVPNPAYGLWLSRDSAQLPSEIPLKGDSHARSSH